MPRKILYTKRLPSLAGTFMYAGKGAIFSDKRKKAMQE